MSETDDLGAKLDEMALALADRAMGTIPRKKHVPIQEFTTAFRALSSYYAMKHKLTLPTDEEKAYGWKQAASVGNGANRGTGAAIEPDF